MNVGTPLIVWSAYVNKNEKDEDKYLAWGADAALTKFCEFESAKKAIWKCLVTPRYEREFHYKLKILQKEWQEQDPAEWIKKINDLRHLPSSTLDKALRILIKYQRCVNFSIKEENSP